MTNPITTTDLGTDLGAVSRRVRILRTLALLAFLLVLFALVPALSFGGVMEKHNVSRFGRYLCFAVAALGIDLIWGYTGVLSLCQASLFCMGGYAMAMHLSLPEGGGDVRPEYNNIPQFFFFNDRETLPAFWKPFASGPVAVAIGLLLPMIGAAIFGFFIFKQRVRGVYFAIITQALAWAVFLMCCRNELLLGGTNGLTNFNKNFQRDKTWVVGLYLASATLLVLSILLCRWIVRSRLGSILQAIRDDETRLRFTGFRTEYYKVFAFSVAALLAAAGGMLYVPQNGIITPNIMRVEDSILFVIWVALGGRGRLWGAVVGALVVNFAYSTMTSDIPKTWPFILGGMFLTVVFVPQGLVGLWDRLEARVAAGRGVITAAIPIFTLTAFILAEALGVMPESLQDDSRGLAVKYFLLVGIIVANALVEHRGAISHRLGKLWRRPSTFLPVTSHATH